MIIRQLEQVALLGWQTLASSQGMQKKPLWPSEHWLIVDQGEQGHLIHQLHFQHFAEQCMALQWT